MNECDWKNECEWKNDPWDDCSDMWKTACGNLFTIIEGSPSENGMLFCCYCGKKIVEGVIEHGQKD